MKKADWKDQLNALLPTDYAHENQQQKNLIQAKETHFFRIELDKKGRNGKQATLISGFIGSDDDLKKLAREIKTICGVGGSTRDGEILIQGDFREKIHQILTAKGHKVKRINF